MVLILVRIDTMQSVIIPPYLKKEKRDREKKLPQCNYKLTTKLHLDICHQVSTIAASGPLFLQNYLRHSRQDISNCFLITTTTTPRGDHRDLIDFLKLKDTLLPADAQLR